MVPTVALVEQQYKQFCKYLPRNPSRDDYKILPLSGDSQADNKVPVRKLIMDYDVVVMTPQILVDTLDSENGLWIGDIFTMIIFDECHHTTKGHPYNTVMARIIDRKLMAEKQKQPINLPQVK